MGHQQIVIGRSFLALCRFLINISSLKTFNHFVDSYMPRSGNKYAISAVKTFHLNFIMILIGNISEILIV